MKPAIPEKLLVLAGSGRFPLLAMQDARRLGVRHITLIGFRGQTPRRTALLADHVIRLRVGQLEQLLDTVRALKIDQAILAGQIHPACLFHARFDARARAELRGLTVKTAHSIFGRLTHLLTDVGVEVLPSTLFMGNYLAPAGVLSRRPPDPRERDDLARGLAAATTLGILDIGQTVVVKSGMVLAAEAFEGTNRAIRRGARLGGRGAVVVKAARTRHDMRFDVPVVGMRTVRFLIRSGCTALGIEAGRVLLLDRDRWQPLADRRGLAIVGLESEHPTAPVYATPSAEDGTRSMDCVRQEPAIFDPSNADSRPSGETKTA